MERLFENTFFDTLFARALFSYDSPPQKLKKKKNKKENQNFEERLNLKKNKKKPVAKLFSQFR